jgi:hypothetical protein
VEVQRLLDDTVAYRETARGISRDVIDLLFWFSNFREAASAGEQQALADD